MQHLFLCKMFMALAALGLTTAHGEALPGCVSKCEQQYELEKSQLATLDIADDPFYDIPYNISKARPGDVLRWQDLSSDEVTANWTSVPAGMSVSRFIYMTEDINRKPIAASAFVLLPYSSSTINEPSRKKFPVVAWAHGTSGNAQQCAPSNNQELLYGWEAPFMYSSLGYAVIAPDYAGQGVNSPGGFHYEAGMLHAADVAYSVVAARKVIGHILTAEWVVIGHSEGGMTAWRTNERLALPDQEELLAGGKFIGAVAAAPALRPNELITEEFKQAGDGPLGSVVSVYLLQSLASLYPEIELKDYLTENLRRLLPSFDATCVSTGSEILSNWTVADAYRNTSWLTSPQMLDWQERFNGGGGLKLAADMLVVSGVGDTITYHEKTERDFNRTCAADTNASIQLLAIPILNHDQSFQAAQPYYMEWVRQRFEGVALGKGCERFTYAPSTDRYKTVSTYE